MKARLYCHIPVNDDGALLGICRSAKLFDADAATIRSFNKYLLSALGTDFPLYYINSVQELLYDIEKMERGEAKTAYWDGADFYHSIDKRKVTFEHTIFGECIEWPVWSCTLAQYKTALQGWHRFLKMPISENSELIVNLPEGVPM